MTPGRRRHLADRDTLCDRCLAPIDAGQVIIEDTHDTLEQNAEGDITPESTHPVSNICQACADWRLTP